MIALLLLFADDRSSLSLFDGETTFGWKIDGEAKVEKRILVLGGTKATKAETTAALLFGTTRIEARWTGDKPPLLRFPSLASLPDPPGQRALDSRKHKWTAITCVHLSEKPANVKIIPESLLTGLKEEMLATSTGIALKEPLQAGPLSFDVPAGTKLELRLVRHVPDLPSSLFDGKTLDGWKVFKGDPKREKSTFTVKDGILSMKSGPGDLQSDKKLDDFVLQVECRTNGKHLNSGVFFRCIPGEYQNGYECQIHNDFALDPPKKHLVGKAEILSAAKDYGTGAIYRRVPARKAVAKDGEWFTLTIVARGRHFATWVDGIQQVDWTDDRKEDANPRKGYRSEAGPISLQGHDPTTDLSFRNIRYAAIPRKP